MTQGASVQPPLTLYAHLPWCARKCPYCDFNSHVGDQALPEDRYIDALLADLDLQLPRAGDRPLQSVFIGGGTPSLFTPGAIARLLEGISARMPMAGDVEVTLEANPGTVEQARFAGFRSAGVNRLSVGVQSLQDDHLRALGRIHDAAEARRAVANALDAGLDSVNLDLMYGLPGQTPGQAAADVDAAIALGPDHISYYQLTLEPDTRFYRYPPELPHEDDLWQMQVEGQRRLAEAGYGQYEVSAYARQGHRCRHNLNYWAFGDYLGIGAGAHGKMTSVEGAIVRDWRHRHPQTYMAKASYEPAGGRRQLDSGDAIFEFMLNALRLTDGFPLSLFVSRTGLPARAIRGAIDEAVGRGLLSERDGWLRPTPLGQRFLNDLMTLFLPEESSAA